MQLNESEHLHNCCPKFYWLKALAQQHPVRSDLSLAQRTKLTCSALCSHRSFAMGSVTHGQNKLEPVWQQQSQGALWLWLQGKEDHGLDNKGHGLFPKLRDIYST